MKKYLLTIILFAMFASSWAGQTWFGWVEYQTEEATHGEVADLAGYGPVWARATLENWESEFLQLFSFVLLSAFFIHEGSPQSKDGDERMERKIDAILADMRLTVPEQTDGSPRSRTAPPDKIIKAFTDWSG